MADLFGILNLAKSGMSAQQTAISISSHNISNANTEGYSRQIANLETSRPFSTTPGQIGTGVQVSSIQRVRDTFMDYQVRSQTSIQGKYTARDQMLGQVENIINEPTDTGISSLVGKFFDSWQELSKQPQSSNARTVVAQQSAALADSLNQSYNQLQDILGNAKSVIKDTVFQANDWLKQVDQLNQQIVSVNITGQSPNDLMDKRDLLIDKLSNEFGIKIDKANFDGEDVTPTDITPLDTGVSAALVKTQDNTNVKRFSYINDIQPPTFTAGTDYTISYYKNGDATSKPETIVYENIDEATFNQLNDGRVIWADKDGNAISTDGKTIANGAIIDFSNAAKSKLATFQPANGELNGYMSVQQDVSDYIDQLNKLAKSIALSVNAVESGQADATNDGMPFFVNSEAANYTNGTLAPTDLATALSGEKDITAGNISVNQQILGDVMQIKTRQHDNQFTTEALNTIDANTDNTRALAVAQLRYSLIDIQSMDANPPVVTDRKTLVGAFTDADNTKLKDNTSGTTIDNYFKDTVDKLGVQEGQAKKIVQTQDSLLASLNQSKESISGVSIDEEMSNLIQFQHAYQASAKIISTIDQLLDVVINGLMK